MAKKRAVVVTTDKDKCGVFFGFTEDDDAMAMTLTGARNVVYWSADVKGVGGLAANGPTAECRIGPAVPRWWVDGITSVMDCSEAAIKAFDAEPWE